MKTWIGTLFLSIGLCFCSSCESPSAPNSNSHNNVAENEDSQINLPVDSSKCIKLKRGNGCAWEVVCPTDSGIYEAVKWMLYVDSNLAEGEPKAEISTCGASAQLLGSDSIEMIAFNHWYGGSYEDMFIYWRKRSGKFKRLKNFNLLNEARRMEVLEATSNGVHHFKVREGRSWITYTLAFNGDGFDTNHILDIPYEEFKKSGLRIYGAEKTFQEGTFKFVHAGRSVNLSPERFGKFFPNISFQSW